MVCKTSNPYLGAKVRDRITGFSGVVTGYVEYLTGCNQVLVVPPIGNDGAFRDSMWFDVQRVEIVALERIVLDNGATPGADRSAPKR